MVERILQLNREKTLFWSLLGIFIFSISFYMYLINTAVHNVVSSQNLEAKISGLNLAISNKEFQYINSKNAITMVLAYSMGFREASPKTYLREKFTNSVSFLSD